MNKLLGTVNFKEPPESFIKVYIILNIIVFGHIFFCINLYHHSY